MRGLPASGKTTWAKDFIKDNPNYVRVCRDDIRSMLTPNFKFGGEMEELVTQIEWDMVINALLYNDYSVIIDSTGFRMGTREWKEVLEIHAQDVPGSMVAERFEKLEIEIKAFDVDMKTCIQRDQQRTHPVGKEVIERMNNKYLVNG